MNPDDALCMFCGKASPLGTPCCEKRGGFLSGERAAWAVGYAVGLAEGMDKLRALRAAVRVYLEENPLPARNPEARAELLRLVKQDN